MKKISEARILFWCGITAVKLGVAGVLSVLLLGLLPVINLLTWLGIRPDSPSQERTLSLISFGIFLIVIYTITSILVNHAKKSLGWAKPKIKTEKQKSIPATPYLRGKGLDLQMSKYFPRKEGEEDWEYVKRIFPEVHKKNPAGAVSILFGRSITELSGVNRQLAGDFLMSEPSSYDIKNFLRGFPRDPAYD
jgi:hypothetical protein